MTKFLDNLQSEVLVLSQQEREFLDKYGDWLERLASGLITPTTERQVQFLSVIRGERKPEHPNEELWLRVQKARESIRVREESVKVREKAEKDRVSLVRKLGKKTALVEELNLKIEALKREIEGQNDRIVKLQSIADKYEPIQLEPSVTKKSAYEICHQCGGDGGAGGRCPRCGGNGFEPQSAR